MHSSKNYFSRNVVACRPRDPARRRLLTVSCVTCLVLLCTSLAIFKFGFRSAEPSAVHSATSCLPRRPRQRPAVASGQALPNASRSIVVRYAVMGNICSNGQPVNYAALPSQLEYFNASICSVERYLRPLLSEHNIGMTYLLYVDSVSEPVLSAWLADHPNHLVASAQLVNLDTDPGEPQRLAAVQSVVDNLNVKNLYSVRRFFADMAFMPAAQGKLMLGTDFEFVNPPRELVADISQWSANKMSYLHANGNWKVNNYSGPQCVGLLGDMYYISPGQPFNVSEASRLMIFYAQLPLVPNRTTPPCGVCVVESHGMHAWDQFVAQLYYGLWTNGSCRVLSPKYMNVFKADPSLRSTWEGVHTKTVFPCEL